MAPYPRVAEGDGRSAREELIDGVANESIQTTRDSAPDGERSFQTIVTARYGPGEATTRNDRVPDR